jgi:Flp pilus assembly protein protease CpaA
MEQIISFFFCLAAGLIDIRTRSIPDLLLIIWVLCLVFFNIYTKNAFVWDKFISGSLMFVLFYLLFRRTGSIGFGDVKFAGVVGYALNFDKLPL